MDARRKKILFIFALLALYTLGIEVRTNYFRTMGHKNTELFWMESAQRYRHAEMVSQGKPIPKLDKQMQWPDGLVTAKDTILEEQLAGTSYRILKSMGIISDMPFYTYVRYFLRAFYSLGIIAVGLICFNLTGSYLAAIIAAFFYSFALVSTSRAMAITIYREHISIPFMAFHVYFFIRAGKSEKIFNDILSAIFLLMALITWKVMRYYFLAFVVFMAFEMYIGPALARSKSGTSDNAHLMRAMLINVLIILAASLALDTHLRYDRFPFSIQMAALYALIISGLSIKLMGEKFSFPGSRKALTGLSIFFLFFAVLYTLFPKMGGYEHVYETIFSKLKYWEKPDDPTLLSFHARHYWGGPYDTPSLYRFLSHMGILVILSIYPGYLFIRRYLQNELPPRGFYMFYGALAFIVGYVTFYKLQTFTVFFLGFFMGYFYYSAINSKGRRRIAMIALLLMGMSLELHQTVNAGDTFYSRSIMQLGIKPPQKSLAFTPSYAKEDMYRWIKNSTNENDAVLASFIISPSILTYAERPIILNCFFESTEMLNRYKEHADALFGSEDDLYKMARKYKAAYVLIDAGMLLRKDKDMSYRYVAAAGDINPEWILYKMHFEPEALTKFDLAYQNDFMRIYEVGKPYSGRSLPKEPVFSQKAFNQFAGKGQSAGPDFLKRYLKAYKLLRKGRVLASTGGQANETIEYFRDYIKEYPEIPDGYIYLGAAQRDLGIISKDMNKMKEAIASLEMAVEIDPKNSGLIADLGMLYADTGDKNKALEYLNKALELKPDMRRVLLELARIHFRNKEWEASEKYLNKVLDFKKDDMDALNGLKAIKDARKTEPDAIEEKPL